MLSKSLHAGVTGGEYYLQRVLVCVTPPNPVETQWLLSEHVD